MNKIRFGIMGCGDIAARFAGALAQSPVAELYAVAARDGARAEAFAKEHGASVSYDDYKKLAADEKVEAVYIATVHITHAELAKICIEAGKPVICEKPFFMNGQEAEEVVQLAREKGVLIMEGFWTRTMPAFQKAKEWIREGKIGDITLIRAAFCFPMPYNEETKSHRLYNPALGGGALLDAGVYPYEYATGIMDGAPSQVKTVIQTAPTGVDETVTMSMQWPNGTIADLVTSVHAYADATGSIAGTKGYILQYNFLGCRKTELYAGWGDLVETFEDPVEEGFVHEIAHFVQLIEEGKTESSINTLESTLDFAHRCDEILSEIK